MHEIFLHVLRDYRNVSGYEDMTGCDITRPGDSSHICRFSPTLTVRVSREISHIRRLNATPLYTCMLIIYLCIRRSNCPRYLPNLRILDLFTSIVLYYFLLNLFFDHLDKPTLEIMTITCINMFFLAV